MPHRPTFENPPVVEVVLGVQFDPLPDFTNAHLGVFWHRLGIEAWPVADDQLPLPQQFERFGSERQWAQFGTMNIGLAQKPSSRSRFTNSNKDRILQLQNGRFHYSWVGTSVAIYPRYEAIRNEMADIYERFDRFVRDYHLGELRLNQWEISYTNTIPRGTVWNQPGDWANLFRSNAMLPTTVVANTLEQFGGRWMYEMPQAVGRLHVELNSAKDKPDGQDILLLQLTARGPIADGASNIETALAGIDIGHENIVNGFSDLTSEDAKRYWKEVT